MFTRVIKFLASYFILHKCC